MSPTRYRYSDSWQRRKSSSKCAWHPRVPRWISDIQILRTCRTPSWVCMHQLLQGLQSRRGYTFESQPSPHFSYSEINALPLNGQQAVTAISALWLRRSTAFRWLQQPIGRHLMIDVVEQVIERHQEVKNEGIVCHERKPVGFAEYPFTSP